LKMSFLLKSLMLISLHKLSITPYFLILSTLTGVSSIFKGKNVDMLIL
jgi:hypothetical protein